MDDLAQQAIRSAVEGNWQTAERLNRTLLENNPADIDAILRLANALAQLGKIQEAQTHYDKVLKMDPYNPFAKKGLERIKRMKKTKNAAPTLHELQTTFLEEPGKTKTLSLVYLANPHILAQLYSGEKVQLVPRRHRISVTTEKGIYVGRLPDDISVRLLGFMVGGNRYEAVIKVANPQEVKIFIREIHRSAKFETTPSFPYAGNSTFQGEEQLQ